MKPVIKPISKEALDAYLSVPDLTQAKEDHVIKLLYEKIKKHVENTHPQSEVRVYRPGPIVSVKDNYDRLLIPADNVGRNSTYTHYITEDTILRTHTSAHIPGILDDLAKTNDWNDIVILLPGLIYRRDVTDRKHLGVIHQLEMWRVVRDKNHGGPITKNDFMNVIEGLAELCAPGWKLRIVDMPHPYTKQGCEVNLVKNGSDIEILEGGLINDQLLTNSGLDPQQYSGWAMRMGLDRLVMTLKNIPDIRYLRSTNPDIAKQMRNLDDYVEVSNQPAIKRDLSYCVPETYVEEDINEDIRLALGNDVSILESVTVLNETLYTDLPEVARAKLGCKKDQKNVLVRVTLRHLSKTLTDQEANELYSRIYQKVNYGSKGYI